MGRCLYRLVGQGGKCVLCEAGGCTVASEDGEDEVKGGGEVMAEKEKVG